MDYLQLQQIQDRAALYSWKDEDEYIQLALRDVPALITEIRALQRRVLELETMYEPRD